MMRKSYVSPNVVTVNLNVASYLLSNSDTDIDHLENGTDGDAGAKGNSGAWTDEALFIEEN